MYVDVFHLIRTMYSLLIVFHQYIYLQFFVHPHAFYVVYACAYSEGVYFYICVFLPFYLFEEIFIYNLLLYPLV